MDNEEILKQRFEYIIDGNKVVLSYKTESNLNYGNFTGWRIASWFPGEFGPKTYHLLYVNNLRWANTGFICDDEEAESRKDDILLYNKLHCFNTLEEAQEKIQQLIKHQEFLDKHNF